MISSLPWESAGRVPGALVEAAESLEQAVARRRKLADLALPEERLAARLRTVFRAQERGFLRRLEAARLARTVVEAARLWEADDDDELDVGDWERLYDEAAAETAPALESALATWIDTALHAGFAAGLAPLQVQLSLQLANPRAAAYANERAAALVTQIDGVTREQIRKLVTQATSEGQSYQQLAREIRERYATMHTPQPQRHIRDRAELIAIQELGEAYEAGNYAGGEAMLRAGVALEKYWLTVGDDRVDQEICAANQAQGWIPFRAEYQSGHQRPLGHVGCRCTQLTRRKPEGD